MRQRASCLRRWRRAPSLALALAALLATGGTTSARTLAEIKEGGTIGLCAHPNSLPFASKTSELPGFQIELGRAIAHELGVSLTPDWVLTAIQVPRARCDMMLDTIADPEVAADSGMRISKPYYRSGVGLAIRRGSPIESVRSLNAHTKVGVLVGSVAGMTLGQRGVAISIFGFEEDMLNALANHEIDAAAVTPITSQYFIHVHPDQAITMLPPDQSEPDLSWNVAVGLRRPDEALRAAIDAALGRLAADGTIRAIYARYGITLAAPQ